MGGVLTILSPGAYPSPFKQGPSYLPLSSFLFSPVMLALHVSAAFHGFLFRRGGQQTLPLSRAHGATPGLTSQLLQIRHAVIQYRNQRLGETLFSTMGSIVNLTPSGGRLRLLDVHRFYDQGDICGG